METSTVMTDQPTNPDSLGERHELLLEEFSRRLREARESRWPKPKQREWAEQMGLTDVRQYQRWEHGEQLPSFERLPLIIEVSGIDITDLFEPPDSLSREDMKTYFDGRIDELRRLIEASVIGLQDSIIQVQAEIYQRSAGNNGL